MISTTAITSSMLVGVNGVTPTASATPPVSAVVAAQVPSVYGDGLATGWSNWSWESSTDLRAASDATGGLVIRWQPQRAWAGLYLHHGRSLAASPDAAVQLRVRALQAGTVLGLQTYDEALRISRTQRIPAAAGQTLPAGHWSTVSVRLGDLSAAGRGVTGVALVDLSGSAGHQIEVDDVHLADVAGIAAPSTAPVGSHPEQRPGNAGPNSTRGRATDPSRFFGHQGFKPYYAQINGNFTGTTEEILEWAAAKWGFDKLARPDLAKAIAVTESWWRQDTRGRVGELGVLQVNPAAWPDAGPAAWSTAYSADYGMAVIRHHYDGQSWLGLATQGNLRNSVAAWECGCGRNGDNWYATRVFNDDQYKIWRTPGVAPHWF